MPQHEPEERARSGLRRHSSTVVALGLLVIAGCSSGSPPPETVTASTATTTAAVTAEPTAVGEVDIGGYRLGVECEGEGSPTVVFEAGGGGDRTAFADQFAEVARVTRVCAYDRAGIGTSDERPATGSTTLGDLADELALMLDGAGIDGPIVLVGHSLGGGIAQLFADRYADRVAGLVFVDSIVIPGYVDWFGPQVDDGTGGTIDMQATTTEWEETGPFGSIPMIVLTQAFVGEDSSVPEEFRRYFRSAHDDLASRSSNGVHVIAEASGHMIPRDSPALVTVAIEEVVQAVRSGDELPPCDDRFEDLDGACP